jgi:hypothetical protein
MAARRGDWRWHGTNRPIGSIGAEIGGYGSIGDNSPRLKPGASTGQARRHVIPGRRPKSTSSIAQDAGACKRQRRPRAAAFHPPPKAGAFWPPFCNPWPPPTTAPRTSRQTYPLSEHESTTGHSTFDDNRNARYSSARDTWCAGPDCLVFPAHRCLVVHACFRTV